jgi:hypothetical protein
LIASLYSLGNSFGNLARFTAIRRLVFREQLRRRRRSFLFDAEPKLLNPVQYSMGLSQGDPERRPVLSKLEARQGVTGHNVRYVLWFGLAAVIVAFAAIYFFYFD